MESCLQDKTEHWNTKCLQRKGNLYIVEWLSYVFCPVHSEKNSGRGKVTFKTSDW